MSTPSLASDPTPVSGEVQFWRLAPESWEAALDGVVALGIAHVATYLSWRRHEPVQGRLDFTSGPLNVRRFLDLCAERNLRVHIKPGPWICAEEPGGGLPDWVMERIDLLARDWEGQPVIGYNPPFRHPVPSYASAEFRALTAAWYAHVWEVLGDHAKPGGIVEAVQLDNEPSVAFQDAMYRCDYSDAAVAGFRRFVLERHGGLAEVSQAWDQLLAGPDDIVPPVPGPAGTPGEREHDWITFHEHYIADYLAFLHATVAELGSGHLTATVNLNTHPVRAMPQSGRYIISMLRAARPDATLIVGEDHYFVPPIDPDDLALLELGARLGARSGSDIVWSPELQAGIWRSPGELVEYPDPTDEELAAWWGIALAFGYQGFNLYMLVNRENWEFAPVAADGQNTSAGRHLSDLLRRLRQVGDLRQWHATASVNLVWDRQMRERAYVQAGTQAHPVELWTRPEEIAAYQDTLALMRDLTLRGLVYRLCAEPGDLDPALPTVAVDSWSNTWGADLAGPAHLDAPVTCENPGVVARLLQGTNQTMYLVVVAWHRNTGGGHVGVKLTGVGDATLTEALTGTSVTANEGAARLPLDAVVSVWRIGSQVQAGSGHGTG